MTQIAVQRKLYPVLAGEVGVVNTNYAYGDVFRFGAVGDGVTDDAPKIQAAINEGKRAGTPVIARGLFAIASRLVISPDGYHSFSTSPIDDYSSTPKLGLVWIGAPGSVMVEILDCDGAYIPAIVCNNRVNNIVGVTGILIHNSDGTGVAGSHNRYGLLAAHGCLIGINIGDFTHDGYDSNCEESEIERIHCYDTDNPVLLDSLGQDHWTFKEFHGGGHPSGRPRDYIIRALRNGNNFSIINGFARMDDLIAEHVALDIQSGAFSITGLFNLEGATNPNRLLDLADSTGRDWCKIRGLNAPTNIRDSAGLAGIWKWKSGMLAQGCSFPGNIAVYQPLVDGGNEFQTTYDFVETGGGIVFRAYPIMDRANTVSGVTVRNFVSKFTEALQNALEHKLTKVVSTATILNNTPYTVVTCSLPDGNYVEIEIKVNLFRGTALLRNIGMSQTFKFIAHSDNAGNIKFNTLAVADFVEARDAVEYTVASTITPVMVKDEVLDTVTCQITQVNQVLDPMRGNFIIKVKGSNGNNSNYPRSSIVVA